MDKLEFVKKFDKIKIDKLTKKEGLEEFSQNELTDIINKYYFDSKFWTDDRTAFERQVICKIGERLFNIKYTLDLEKDDNAYNYQPIEVEKKQYKKISIITEYVPINKENK